MSAERFFIMLPGIVGIVVLIGWSLGSNGAERLWLPSETMNPVTALCFVSLGFGLLFRREGTGRLARALATGLIGLVALAALAKLCDALGLAQVPVDSQLFAARLQANPGHPSRIAPNAALALTCLGLGALSIGRGGERRAITGQVLAIVGATIALFAITGYVYRIVPFYDLPAFIPMALHTAVCSLSIAAAIILATADRGLILPISDRGAAGQSARILMPAALLMPLGLGWLWLTAERRGILHGEVGVAVMVIMTALLMAALVWWNSRKLLAVDRRRAAAEAELLRLATHDHLTGLPNRACFMDRLMTRLSLHQRLGDDFFAVIYMDLDGFKQVNDRLGHEAGDRLLRQVADHLRRCSRGDDLVARLGGDEFTMLLNRIGTPQDAETVAARIVAEMPKSLGPAGSEIPVGISLGIVIGEIRHRTPDAVLSEADRALYAAKRGGKGRFEFFSEPTQEPV